LNNKFRLLSLLSRILVFGDVRPWNSKSSGDLYNVRAVLLVSQQTGLPKSVRGSGL